MSDEFLKQYERHDKKVTAYAIGCLVIWGLLMIGAFIGLIYFLNWIIYK